MERAHLYEALYLANHGIDEAYFEWEAEEERVNKDAMKRHKPIPKAGDSVREKRHD